MTHKETLEEVSENKFGLVDPILGKNPSIDPKNASDASALITQAVVPEQQRTRGGELPGCRTCGICWQN